MSDTAWLSPGEQVDWQAFIQMQELLRSRLEQALMSRSGLSNADYTVLAVLSEAPEHRMRPFDLSRGLGWEKSRLHHQLTRMCDRGLVERRPDPGSGNARAVQVVLTPHGLAAIRAAAPGHVRDVRRLALDALTDEQLAQLGDISRAVIARVTAD
jgi:DNA-binding MarR family transcriptional regulator